MNVEQTLTDELRAVATGVTAPPPPHVDALVTAAERARGRTRLTVAGCALAAAAVVAAIVIGSQVGRPNAAPQPVRPSPSYYAAGVPYVYKGELYIDHARQPGHWLKAESAGGYTAAIRSELTAEILHDGKQVLQIGGQVYELRLSPDGTKAAWIVSTGLDTGELVVRDLPGSRELGRVPLTLRARGDQGIGTSLQVEDTGRVLYDVNDTHWSWKPGGRPTRFQQPDGTVVNPVGFPGIEAWVRLSPDHLWGAWLTDRDGKPRTEGSDTLGVTFQKPGDPASRFTLTSPFVGDGGHFPSWESPTLVTVQLQDAVAPNGQRVVACDVVARTCTDATDTYLP